MMYQDKLAVAIKVNGKVLREGKSQGSERDDTVFIPFGSEYTLYVKNMNSVRALVRFSIDGTDATEGVSIIVPANGFIELERFIKNANFNEGLKFKFIERTKKIEDGPRGIKVEDGLIRVEYEFEREPAKIVNAPYTITTSSVYYPPVTKEVHHHHHHTNWRDMKLGANSAGEASFSANAFHMSDTLARDASDASFHDGQASLTSASASMDSMAVPQNSAAPVRAQGTRSTLRSSSASRGLGIAASAGQESFKMSKSFAPVDANEKGITVGGAKSDQTFERGSWFPTDGVKHVMIIKILGETGKGKVEKAVTVKTKQECPTCGTKNKHGTKFCRECGTGLEQV